MRPDHLREHAFSRRPVRITIVLLFLVLALPGLAQAQEVQCETALTDANTHYQFGRFNQAATLLEACIRQDAFSQEEKPEVYKLLVQIYDASQLEEQARNALRELLRLVPNYQPDPEDPDELKALVETVRQELEAAAAPEEPPAEEPPPAQPTPPTMEVTPATTHGEGIANVRLQPEGDRLRITYDLTGTGKKYEVSLLLSTDGGASYEALPETVAGEVGKGIRPGAGKQILWAALDDFPEGLSGGNYRVQVTADKQGGRGLLYVLGGAVLAGGGTTIALLLGSSDEPPVTPTCPPDCPPFPAPPSRPGGN